MDETGVKYPSYFECQFRFEAQQNEIIRLHDCRDSLL